MKVVAYGIQSCEREFLATANHKKHDITLIGNSLTEETLFYAAGKQAVIVTDDMNLSEELTTQLRLMGINHIISRELCTDESEPLILQEMATQVIRQLDML